MVPRRFPRCSSPPPAVLVALMLLSPVALCQLDCGYYDDSCPDLEDMVQEAVWSAMQKDPRIAASLLRMHFHDCFVNGCDGSVLLDDTPTSRGEKSAVPNSNSLRGFEVIDTINAELEKHCPSAVSCTDILALAARDATFLSGGPHWSLPLGRRDGGTSTEDAANSQLPSPFEPVHNITAKFASKGLSLKDVVALSGAHTIGFATCATFKTRLFDHNGSGRPDPRMEASMLRTLQAQCPSLQDAASDSIPAALDTVTVKEFDNAYYKNLVGGKGLLQSDQDLVTDPGAAPMVAAYSGNQRLFFSDFAASMIKLGGVGVLTGDKGEIRKNCRVVN